MPRPAKVLTAKVGTVLPAPVNVQAQKEEGLKLITPLQSDVEALTVKTAEDYEEADHLLHRINTVRKTWVERTEKIIRPIRQGLDELYALNREVTKPLDVLEAAVKGHMKAFKLEEQRLIQAAANEARRLEEEAQAQLRKAELAATPQLKGRLQTQAARTLQQAIQVEQHAPMPVMAATSTTRPVKVPGVSNLSKFLKGIADGYIPADCIEIKQGKLNTYYKDDPEGFEAWPGVTVTSDVQIVGR